ncbi:hypothetical protein Natpe_3944 (plasmid) [Natrinema pellirubrum DSM 15624]|uniref:Uncharacterized protein n=2 Tax=Natrinema pellirubrum (strain DSM 15624 / CIP 106293 / JCM 10476 / NCIMB 786 / 157) TaxID=797303 RepID=L0JR14_NATP1|nr:hypothetical protein [Natrinema pellirubrum]AGB33694.1 hypothetical protein Natpe_3944 [Natrinema pellirubrum DSM 15624]
MLRRAFLNTVATLPGVSLAERLFAPPEASSPSAESIEQEGDMWFWYYVYTAIREDRVMSTEQSRKHAVNEMNLTTLSNTEARQVLKRANDGEYTSSDMPDQWREVFDSIDRVEFR